MRLVDLLALSILAVAAKQDKPLTKSTQALVAKWRRSTRAAND